MLNFVTHNKIVVGATALIVVVGIWYGMRDAEPSGDLLVTETFTGPESEVEKDLVATLLELRSISLDGTIFSDPAFLRLADYGSEIIPEPIGRPNPFAPLEGASTTAPVTSPARGEPTRPPQGGPPPGRPR